MSRSSVDPRNNQLIRHLFNVGSVQTNPEDVDMSAVIPTLEWGQQGYSRIHDNSKMVGCEVALSTTGGYGILSLHAPIIVTEPGEPSSAHISIPPGHAFYLLRVNYDCQIESIAWLSFFNGRMFNLLLSGRHPAPNMVSDTWYNLVCHREVPIATETSQYTISFSPRMWFPEGCNYDFYVTADNTQYLYSTNGGWPAGTGMDLPNNNLPTYVCQWYCRLWGILVPIGCAAPQNIVG